MRRFKQRMIKGFTLFESLLTLSVIAFLTLILSGTAQFAFQTVQEQVFLWEFESLYQESQQLAAASHHEVVLEMNAVAMTNGYQKLAVPKTVQVQDEQHIVFSENGGNSSLAKVRFELSRKTVVYQLYLGSGRYKKTEE